MFLAAIGFLIASLVSGDPVSPVREKWIIDSTQKEKWDNLLQTAGVTQEYVQDVLEQYLVQVDFGDATPTPCHPAPIKKHHRQPQRLYENEHVTVYYPSNPRVRHHLWIVLNRPVDRFAEVASDEMVQMRAMVNQILELLQKNFGLTALIAQWNAPQSEQLEHRFTIEVIPNRLDSLQEHNLQDKAFAHSYLLFRDIFAQPELSLEYDEVDLSFWRQALGGELPKPFPTTNDPDPTDAWVQTQSHINEAGIVLTDHLYELITTSGINIERVQISDVTQPDTLVVPKSGCAFCMDKVINSQKVHESTYCWVLFNFKPAIPKAHFLIVPKRHVHSSDHLLEEEVRDMHHIAQTLTEILAKREGREDVTMYIQNGFQVGQTVKHVQMHVLLTPDPLRCALFSLNYDREKTLMAEELRAVTSELSF